MNINKKSFGCFIALTLGAVFFTSTFAADNKALPNKHVSALFIVNNSKESYQWVATPGDAMQNGQVSGSQKTMVSVKPTNDKINVKFTNDYGAYVTLGILNGYCYIEAQSPVIADEQTDSDHLTCTLTIKQ